MIGPGLPGFLIALVLVMTVSGLAPGQVRVADAAQLRAALAEARPGQRILLAPGDYGSGWRLVALAGAPGRPIVLGGADPKRPPVFAGGVCALHLVRCRHVTLRNLEVRGCSGNGINVDDGGVLDAPAVGITLEDLAVFDTGPRGNHDGIKLSGVADFAVRRCRVVGWGGSAIDMVGCHRGVVEDCSFTGKPGFSQSNGVQVKGGSAAIRILGCYFEAAGHRSINAGGSTGLQFFRPRDARFEAEDLTIAGNRFVGSQAGVAFVNARRVVVRHNTFYRPEKWVLRILQETVPATGRERFPACREGTFERNLVVYDRRVRIPVNVGPNTAPQTFVFRDNAWFGLAGASRGRLPVQEPGAVLQVDPRLRDAGSATMRATTDDPRLRRVGVRAYRRKR